MKKISVTTAGAALLTLSLTAQAFERGDIIVRGGLANVDPDSSTSNVTLNNADLGFGLEVDSNTQLGLNFAYFLSDRLNVELLAATPFKHDVSFAITDPLGTGNQLGEVTHLPPTVTLNYYFGDQQSSFKPYAGVGLNYTTFFDEEFTGTNQGAGLADLELDDSFGLAAQLGADYMVNERWFLNGSVRWIDIDTEASFNLAGTPGRVDSIEIDPFVYSLTLGYRFN